jgi:signal transduction histidine kinase
MTVVLATLRLNLIRPGRTPDPDDLLPLLIAVALLCVIGLTRREHQSAAWLATIGATFVVTVDLATLMAEGIRALRPAFDVPGRQWMAVVVSLSATLAVAAAAAYGFSRPSLKGGRFGVEATVAAALVITGIAIWAIANPDAALFEGLSSDLGSLGLVTRTFLVLVPLFTALGIIGDVLPAAVRAQRRVALTHRGSAGRRERAAAWLRAFLDELAPGRSRAREAAVIERTRIARDIHADVVPGIRQALADAERGVPAEQLAASLRGVLADVEAVGATAHPIQLEIGGLVSALEWLVERVEHRSGIAVTLEVADPPAAGADAGEPPGDVSSAAFRVAVLALSNIAFHAPESQSVVRVRSDSRVVDLSIVDDGPGISDDALAAARSKGRRGMADMAAEATACGAIVEVGPGPGEVGTAVSFWWEAPPGR